jgi:hypothetical protein
MIIAIAMASLMLTVCPMGGRAAVLRYGHASLVSNDNPAMGFDLPLPGRYTARDQAPYAGALENGYPMDLSNERVANNYVTQRFPTSLRSAGTDTGNGQLIHVPEAPKSPGEIPPYVPEVPEDRRDYSRPASVRNGIRIRKKDDPTTAAPNSLTTASASYVNATEMGADVGAKIGKKLGSKAGASAGAVLGPGGMVVGHVVGGMVGSAVGKSAGAKVGAQAENKLIKENSSDKAEKEDTPQEAPKE